MSITHVSDTSFESDVLQSSSPVLVDFWAEWCAPCKHIVPAPEEIARDLAGRPNVAQVDLYPNPATPGLNAHCNLADLTAQRRRALRGP